MSDLRDLKPGSNLNILKPDLSRLKPGKKPGGRPKKENPATERVTLYFTPEEKAAIQRVADHKGIGLATALRMHIIDNLGL